MTGQRDEPRSGMPWPWSMTWGRLKLELAGLPDDTVLLIEDDLDGYDLHVGRRLPVVLDHPGLVTFERGQVVNSEHDLDMRIDAQIGYDG